MLFKPYHIYPMHIGLKTYTRRFWKHPHVKIGGEYDVTHKMMYQPEDVIGFIQVEDIYRQPLGMITEQDAQNEGGYNRAAYFDLLKEIVPSTKIGLRPDSMYVGCYVVKFRFVLSDLIDGNGGDFEIRNYYDLWKDHMKKFGIEVHEYDHS